MPVLLVISIEISSQFVVNEVRQCIKGKLFSVVLRNFNSGISYGNPVVYVNTLPDYMKLI